MPDTPLNPDAIFTAGDVIHENFGVTRKIDHLACTAIAERAVSAYLAVAQPAVNTVEELDALPIGSAIIDKHGDVGLIDCYGTKEKYVQFAQTVAMSTGYTAKHFLPARVMHRPEVKP